MTAIGKQFGAQLSFGSTKGADWRPQASAAPHSQLKAYTQNFRADPLWPRATDRLALGAQRRASHLESVRALGPTLADSKANASFREDTKVARLQEQPMTDLAPTRANHDQLKLPGWNVMYPQSLSEYRAGGIEPVYELEKLYGGYRLLKSVGGLFWGTMGRTFPIMGPPRRYWSFGVFPYFRVHSNENVERRVELMAKLDGATER